MSRLVQLAPGSTFAGEYRVVHAMAEGGMGAIYEVTQIRTGATRALKIMHPTLVSDERLRQRFEQEAKISVLIESDHVVQVLGAGIDAHTSVPWIAMELLKGETLSSFMGHKGPLDAGEVREVFGQLCHAVAAAHDAGIVHRDLKPENIFLAIPRREGIPFTVKVLDFGIAKLVAEAHTHHTAAIGTPLWMAPEQTEVGQAIKPATDVWALGLLAFYAFTGVHFWRVANEERISAATLLREVVLDPLPLASERARALGVEDKLPKDFDDWFGKCVVRPMDERFANARLAREALDKILPESSGRTITGRHPALQITPTYPPHEVLASLGKTGSNPNLDVSAQRRAIAETLPADAEVKPSPKAFSMPPADASETNEPVAHDVPVSGAPKAALVAVLLVAALGVFGWMKLRTSDAPKPAPSTYVSAKPTFALSAPPPVPMTACPPGMANVPGGTFFMASRGDSVTIKPFCLDVTEATVSDYQACIKKGSCTVEGLESEPLCNYKGGPKKERHPINCIDWDQANTLCAANGKRLPTAEEWEWAARGADAGTTFPWGEDAPKEQLCWSGVLERVGVGTCEVKSHPGGVTSFGVHDLAGNVAEWAAPDEKMHESVRPLLGDDWRAKNIGFTKDQSGKTSVATRLAARKLHEATIGVRCAKSP